MFQFGGFDNSDSVALNSWLGLAGGGSVVVCDSKVEVDVTSSCDQWVFWLLLTIVGGRCIVLRSREHKNGCVPVMMKF